MTAEDHVSLARWRAANRCDHGPGCPVWVAAWLRLEDLEELGATGWSYPTKHQCPAVPPRRPRLVLVAVWFAALAMLWGGWALWLSTPLWALAGVLTVTGMYGGWAWCALAEYQQGLRNQG